MGMAGGLGQIRINFDAAAYLAIVDKNAKELMHKAAKAWLKAALTKIPVYTGTAVASLKPLGAFANEVIPVGSATRKTPYKGSTEGRFEFKTNDFIYEFQIETEVFYFLINEYYDVSRWIHLRTPGPWGAFAAGDAAAEKVIQEGLSEAIPDLLGSITF